MELFYIFFFLKITTDILIYRGRSVGSIYYKILREKIGHRRVVLPKTTYATIKRR